MKLSTPFFATCVTTLLLACAHGLDETAETPTNEDTGIAMVDAAHDSGAADAGRDTGNDPGADTGTDTSVADAGRDTGVADAGRDTGVADTGSTTCTEKLLVNEVLTTGAGDETGYEWVEIYNPNTCAVDFTDYKLVYRAATGTANNTLFAGTVSIPARGYLFLGSSAVTGTDGMLVSGMKDTGGAVFIVKGALATRIDGVGWGTADAANREGTAALVSPAGESIARRPNGADTANNAVDFVVAATPTPKAAN